MGRIWLRRDEKVDEAESLAYGKYTDTKANFPKLDGTKTPQSLLFGREMGWTSILDRTNIAVKGPSGNGSEAVFSG